MNAKYSCYVIDDNEDFIQAIIRYIEKVPDLLLIGSNTSPIRAIKEIETGNTPDIIFLDIEMPQLSGLTLLSLLPAISQIIFITGHSKYALQGYENDIADFLLKPFSFERFSKAVSKVVSIIDKTVTFQRSSPEGAIFVNAGIKGKMIRIEIQNIIYVEALDHFVSICTKGLSHITKLSMKQIATILPDREFARIHRSFIINLNKIEYVSGHCIKMQEANMMNIGNAYKTAFLHKLNNMS